MRYQNPLSVFTPDQIEKILTGNYKNLKKEILLQFQLEEGITINLNGQELDKNGVLQIFDSLDSEVEMHAAIYEHKSLLAFLEKEDLDFFNQYQNFEKLKASPHAAKISKLLHDKINNYLGQKLRKFNPQNVRRLQLIYNYTSLLPTSQQPDTYTQGYNALMQYLDSLEKLVPDPFSKNNKVFKPSVSQLVSKDQVEYFKYLPASFDNLHMQYVLWCNDNILLPALSKNASLGSYSKTDLNTLKIAATIAATKFNKANNLEIADTIARYNTKKKRRNWIYAFIFLAVFIKIKLDKNSTGVAQDITDPKYIHDIEKAVSQNDMTSAQTVNLKKYFGLSEPNVTTGDTTIISYTCEHIPNTKRWIAQLTNNALETTPDTKQILKLSLIDEDNPSISLDYIYSLNSDKEYVIRLDATDSQPITMTNNLDKNKSINLVESRYDTQQKNYKKQEYKIKHLENDKYKIWSLKDLTSQTINYKEVFDKEKKYIIDTLLLRSVIRNNIDGKDIAIANSIEIVSNQHFYKMLSAQVVKQALRVKDKGNTVRYRKLEGVNQDIIKVIGPNYCSLIFLNNAGHIMHKQTIIRQSKYMDVIKEWPVK